MNEQKISLQKYVSFTLYSRCFCLCVRDGWRQGQTAILTQLLFLTIAALLPHLGLGCSTGGRWGLQLSVCKLALTQGFLFPTNSTAAGTCLYSFITSTCSRFFFGWLTARSRVNIWQNESTLFRLKKFKIYFLFWILIELFRNYNTLNRKKGFNWIFKIIICLFRYFTVNV